MIDERTAELLVERLIRRIEQANTYFLMKMGSSIKQIRNLTPSQAQELVQMLKYGGNYEDIIKEISKYTNLNVKDIDEIFSEYAKKDRLWSKQFYDYRNIPFDESLALKRQKNALTELVKNEMYNFTRTNVLGYTIRDLRGRPQFLGLKETYNRVLDEALLNVGQGKETFDSAMTRIMKDIGGSGLKTVEFESGRSVRLDSAVRMQLKSRLRELHNEQQKIIGKEIGADGIEISVHSNPAVDHEQAQGRQFSNKEYDKLNNGLEATDYTGKKITLDHDNKNGYRPISEMNCYHYIFSIILGVSKPQYNEEQLQQIINDNEKGFELDGKHYTNYEGTQLQRNIETEIRKQKDTQILAKASGNEELLYKSQDKIRMLTNKYKELSDVSGLPTKIQRLRVSQYRRKAGDTRSFYEQNLLGKTYGEITINGVSKHLLDRKTSRNLWLEDIENGLSNPLKITDVKIDSQGRQSLQYIGERATIVLNPANGNIVSVWKTGSNRVKKLRGEK